MSGPMARVMTVREAALAGLAACGRLSAEGVEVLAAHASTAGARVTVAPPRTWTGRRPARSRWSRHAETLVSQMDQGVVVEWRIPRVVTAAGGGR